MDALVRLAGYFGIAGGGGFAIPAAVVAYDPDSDAWVWFFLVIALLGAAVVGFEVRTRAATGRLGQVSAWLSGLGAVALLVVFGYGLPKNQLSSGGDPA